MTTRPTIMTGRVLVALGVLAAVIAAVPTSIQRHSPAPSDAASWNSTTLPINPFQQPSLYFSLGEIFGELEQCSTQEQYCETFTRFFQKNAERALLQAISPNDMLQNLRQHCEKSVRHFTLQVLRTLIESQQFHLLPNLRECLQGVTRHWISLETELYGLVNHMKMQLLLETDRFLSGFTLDNTSAQLTLQSYWKIRDRLELDLSRLVSDTLSNMALDVRRVRAETLYEGLQVLRKKVLECFRIPFPVHLDALIDELCSAPPNFKEPSFESPSGSEGCSKAIYDTTSGPQRDRPRTVSSVFELQPDLSSIIRTLSGPCSHANPRNAVNFDSVSFERLPLTDCNAPSYGESEANGSSHGSNGSAADLSFEVASNSDTNSTVSAVIPEWLYDSTESLSQEAVSDCIVTDRSIPDAGSISVELNPHHKADDFPAFCASNSICPSDYMPSKIPDLDDISKELVTPNIDSEFAVPNAVPSGTNYDNLAQSNLPMSIEHDSEQTTSVTLHADDDIAERHLNELDSDRGDELSGIQENVALNVDTPDATMPTSPSIYTADIRLSDLNTPEQIAQYLKSQLLHTKDVTLELKTAVKTKMSKLRSELAHYKKVSDKKLRAQRYLLVEFSSLLQTNLPAHIALLAQIDLTSLPYIQLSQIIEEQQTRVVEIVVQRSHSLITLEASAILPSDQRWLQKTYRDAARSAASESQASLRKSLEIVWGTIHAHYGLKGDDKLSAYNSDVEEEVAISSSSGLTTGCADRDNVTTVNVSESERSSDGCEDARHLSNSTNDLPIAPEPANESGPCDGPIRHSKSKKKRLKRLSKQNVTNKTSESQVSPTIQAETETGSSEESPSDLSPELLHAFRTFIDTVIDSIDVDSVIEQLNSGDLEPVPIVVKFVEFLQAGQPEIPVEALAHPAPFADRMEFQTSRLVRVIICLLRPRLEQRGCAAHQLIKSMLSLQADALRLDSSELNEAVAFSIATVAHFLRCICLREFVEAVAHMFKATVETCAQEIGNPAAGEQFVADHLASFLRECMTEMMPSLRSAFWSLCIPLPNGDIIYDKVTDFFNEHFAFDRLHQISVPDIEFYTGPSYEITAADQLSQLDLNTIFHSSLHTETLCSEDGLKMLTTADLHRIAEKQFDSLCTHDPQDAQSAFVETIRCLVEGSLSAVKTLMREWCQRATTDLLQNFQDYLKEKPTDINPERYAGQVLTVINEMILLLRRQARRLSTALSGLPYEGKLVDNCLMMIHQFMDNEVQSMAKKSTVRKLVRKLAGPPNRLLEQLVAHVDEDELKARMLVRVSVAIPWDQLPACAHAAEQYRPRTSLFTEDT